METAQPAQDPLQETQKLFAGFLKNNPKAKIVSTPNPLHRAAVHNAWDDGSFSISIPNESEDLAEALNNVYLPERYSALWHMDSKRLEFIWTAFPLSPLWTDVPGRKFVFRFRGISHQCEFKASSVRLLKIAENFVPISGGNTAFRNLPSFKFHAVDRPKQKEDGQLVPDTQPLSFWISDVDWDDNEILELANHLNFYLTYYDAISPIVVVHTFLEGVAAKPITRFPFGNFPAHIDGREVDDVLLALWQASRTGDNALRFLYCYRIIEYSSFTYLESKARSEIRRVLASPHAMADIGGITEEVINALQRSRQEDFQKCESLLRETVKPSVLWREIRENLSAFCQATDFDGGFHLDAFIHKDCTEEHFQIKGVDNFHKSIRDIRNALSHGKDSRSSGVITPTTENSAKLRPWVMAISVAAGEVMLFRNVL